MFCPLAGISGTPWLPLFSVLLSPAFSVCVLPCGLVVSVLGFIRKLTAVRMHSASARME